VAEPAVNLGQLVLDTGFGLVVFDEVLVEENASRISMISLPDLVTVPPGTMGDEVTPNPSTPKGPPASGHAGHRETS
jgi:hypothetical protein